MNTRLISSLRRLPVLAVAFAAALALGSATAVAGQRKFVYSYEATTAPKGSVEFENWVTWERGREGGDLVNGFGFRHELEIGVTDRLQLGFYLADWSYSSAEKRARYEHSGVEAIYTLTNPTTDWLGSALYLEVVGGNDVLEVEGKLLLQKNIGPVTIAYNAILEAEWEGAGLGEERNGEFAETLGVSYEVIPRFLVGVELLHEIDIADWDKAGDSILFAGPNASVRFGKAFATVACLFHLTDVEDEPDVQTRLIFGFEF